MPEFLLGFGESAVGGVADDVFDAEQLGVGASAVEEDALKHVVMAGAGMPGAEVLSGEQKLRIVLGRVDPAEMHVRPR